MSSKSSRALIPCGTESTLLQYFCDACASLCFFDFDVRSRFASCSSYKCLCVRVSQWREWVNAINTTMRSQINYIAESIIYFLWKMSLCSCLGTCATCVSLPMHYFTVSFVSAYLSLYTVHRYRKHCTAAHTQILLCVNTECSQINMYTNWGTHT